MVHLGKNVPTLLVGTLSLIMVFSFIPQEAFAISFFTDRPSWEAAIGAATIITDPFDNPIADADVIIFDSGVVSTGLNGPGDLDQNEVVGGEYAGNVDKDAVFSYEKITWDFPHAISGFGADFGTGVAAACTGEFLLIISNFEGGGDMTIDLATEMGTPCTGFFGVVSSSLFQTVTYTTGTGGGALNEFWTMDDLSFAATAGVGGELLPINTTALLIAGLQLSAVWMIPLAVSAIGIGAVLIRKKSI